MSIILNELVKIKQNDRKKIGRGIGSGKGKTSGRGVKGQKARTGHHSVRGFEGGQTPVYMRLPKKGFTNVLRVEYEVINIKEIADLVKKKLLAEDAIITKEVLQKLGLVKNLKSKVKLIMGKRDYSLPKIKITVDSYSKSAEVFKS
jgi:large subunit ribosomal protein L15